ncbi:PREDICTED: uncharacterized protein LOC104740146 [Camelina sativa]|uniref:Uncharacterized protein LOC104740146 n=1 Tax=Camelina sativa TaxID=90675 RepID=A0ABM0VNU3_CAMSA|nr:PREDICTED: uncharacterized protein LOC104740146 [Camelina sativa]
MDLSREIDDYIKDTIDHSLGLPISTDALKKKLYTAEESNLRFREQYLTLVGRLKEKDRVIDLVRSEASMNAQALKRVIEEKQRLAGECEDLAIQCKKLKRECFLYDQDRESLMDFGNETDQRAREAESRVLELKEQVLKMSDEIKNRVESEEDDCLAYSVLYSLVSREDESVSSGRSFLEANVEDKCCQALLSKWDELKPSTQKVASLVSMVKRIEKEKECLILNLAKAEQEVELVMEQNRDLDKENCMLLRQCSVERSNGSDKFSKRKSPKLMMTSPIDKRIELSSQDFHDV